MRSLQTSTVEYVVCSGRVGGGEERSDVTQ